MQRRLKTFAVSVLSAVLALAILSPAPAQAQAFGSWGGLTTTLVGGTSPGSTNNIVANTTNTFAVRMDCPRTDNIVLKCTFKLQSTGTSPVEFIIVPGDVDSYPTNNTAAQAHKWNITANGTTGVAGVTNIATGGYPAMWVISMGHNNANPVTNMTFSYGFKR